MAIIWRHSALAQRHAEIGGELEDWNGMGTAWFYDDTPERAQADYEAIRTKAGLMDVSGLKKFIWLVLMLLMLLIELQQEMLIKLVLVDVPMQLF